MASRDDLRTLLRRIDRRSYPAYKEIKGRYDFGDFTLVIDHVQGDPFAFPSRLRILMALDVAGFPVELWQHPSRQIGVCSHLAHLFARAAVRLRGESGSGKSGEIGIDAPGQEVLPTTACLVRDNRLELRFTVGLPARGRTILGEQAAAILCGQVPSLVERTLRYPNLDAEDVHRAACCNEDADHLRALLAERDLVAFVADGAILPRRSGIDPRPLEHGAIPFASPDSLRVACDLPHAGRVTGMGVPRGVTLIVGGGFHGKSTLLAALETSVYNHRPGDGRELVVTDPSAVKIRAEDGRYVAGVDISAFISDLPGGRDTRCFSTLDASGSTSQAANIVEALESGCLTLLIDEDTSATNFMIRDRRMQALIAKDKEPITPFVDNVRPLWQEREISTVLVMGGSGDYFECADTVIAMENYRPRDLTAEAREIAARDPRQRQSERAAPFAPGASRIPLGRSLDPRRGARPESVKSRGVKTVLFGTGEIDVSAVAQIVHPGQLRAIGEALLRVRALADGALSLADILDRVAADIERGGLDVLVDRVVGDLCAFRRFELAAALNRLRTLEVKAPR